MAYNVWRRQGSSSQIVAGPFGDQTSADTQKDALAKNDSLSIYEVVNDTPSSDTVVDAAQGIDTGDDTIGTDGAIPTPATP